MCWQNQLQYVKHRPGSCSPELPGEIFPRLDNTAVQSYAIPPNFLLFFHCGGLLHQRAADFYNRRKPSPSASHPHTYPLYFGHDPMRSHNIGRVVIIEFKELDSTIFHDLITFFSSILILKSQFINSSLLVKSPMGIFLTHPYRQAHFWRFQYDKKATF